MITFEEGQVRFVYRAVGVVLDNGRVLLHRAERDDFWSLPGGRVESLETAASALRREMWEELGVEIYVERLIWVVENFFEHAGTPYHELGLYFLMTAPGDSPLYHQSGPFVGDEENIKLLFQWHPLADLDRLPLYPTFLRKALRAIPAVTEYIVHTDEK